MTSSFLAGVVAGYAIAIPVGAIAVLIVELGVRRGFRIAGAAGAGAATADGLYAALAAIGGVALGAAIEPYEAPLRLVAGAVLLAIAARGLAAMLRGPRAMPGTPEGPRSAAVTTYLRFVGLTLLNPMTVIYFAALMLGLPEIGSGIPERGAFVVGALAASLSWQLVLAAVGAIAHRRLPARFQVGVSLAGNVVIAAFAVRIALGG
ncbi:MAG TPA: LysE family transporter [Candidatus Limnocylindrales bacterium]|nr:LysE family transporter [Candidatus Limnocylindrales bacterium]